jgi:dienelactone hydrolase
LQEDLVREEVLTYEADGLTMRSHLFFEPGASAARPGILVFPEAFGLGEQAVSRAKRLAALGYVTLASDLHGEGKLIQGLETVMGIIGPLRQDPPRIRARAAAGLKALTARSEVDAAKIAAIGYCFGGVMALELARSGAEIQGVVGFHSGLATVQPEDAKNIKGKVLVCIGADDPGVDASERAAFEDEMRTAKVNWQMNLYGGVVHSFTNPDAEKLGRPDFVRYDTQADTRSWAEMQAFFTEIFAPR